MANGAFVSDLESELFRTFIFPETVFTAVTAYQNQLVSKPTDPLTPLSPLPTATTVQKIPQNSILASTRAFFFLMRTTCFQLLIASIQKRRREITRGFISFLEEFRQYCSEQDVNTTTFFKFGMFCEIPVS